MLITGLEYVNLYCQNPEKMAEFYTQVWGLVETGREDGIIKLRTASTVGYSLGLVPSDRKGIEQIGFGVKDRQGVDTLADSIRAKGIQLTSEPQAGPGGYGFTLRDLDNREICFVADRPGYSETLPLPIKYLSHIVLNTVQLEQLLHFYTNLGFVTSDVLEDQGQNAMYFMRGSEQHHNLALVRGRYSNFQHLSFEIGEIDTWMKEIGRLKNRFGINPVWGPGHYAPGNTYFCYYVDPENNVIEYDGGIDLVDDTHQPQTYNMRSTDLWGYSRPTPEVFKLMDGEQADPGKPLAGSGVVQKR
jgi:catechol 2,3-dioxygenase-like lactoylglutathione lyase family enzyme